MRRGSIDKGILLLLVIVVIVAATAVSVGLAVRTDSVSDLVGSNGQLAMLVPIEMNDGRLITEVLFYQFSTDRGALFDVPASTGTVISSLKRIDSIDTVYFTDGIEAYAKQVSSLMGVDIPMYLGMSESDLEAMVDLVGGVPMFVTDLPNEGPDAVAIPSGDVVLDGAKALEYLEFTAEGERDSERVARQQKLVISLLERIGTASNMIAAQGDSRVFMSYVHTNIERIAFVSLASEFSNLVKDRMITRQIEGIERRVTTDDQEEVLLFPHQEGKWLKESVRQVVENLASEESIRDENIVIRIEILNGTAVTGLATRTAALYRSYGFDVVSVGNAQSSEIDATVIVDHVGNDVFAQRTADIIRAPIIETQPETDATVDVTVILGKDFDGQVVR